jgi:hypothetical protein
MLQDHGGVPTQLLPPIGRQRVNAEQNLPPLRRPEAEQLADQAAPTEPVGPTSATLRP